MKLEEHIADHVACGSHHVDRMLGFVKMPRGHALMLDPDEAYFYWLRADGMHSNICWDKWAVFRAAKRDAGNI
jgi:hypothetical protein